MSTATPTPYTSLTDYRLRAKVGRNTLANWFGVNKTTIRYWERARIPSERVNEVSDKLGIPPHVLRPDVFRPGSPRRKT